jgi:hypothetical protein
MTATLVITRSNSVASFQRMDSRYDKLQQQSDSYSYIGGHHVCEAFSTVQEGQFSVVFDLVRQGLPNHGVGRIRHRNLNLFHCLLFYVLPTTIRGHIGSLLLLYCFARLLLGHTVVMMMMVMMSIVLLNEQP